jgi:hypothetical protein
MSFKLKSFVRKNYPEPNSSTCLTPSTVSMIDFFVSRVFLIGDVNDDVPNYRDWFDPIRWNAGEKRFQEC